MNQACLSLESSCGERPSAEVGRRIPQRSNGKGLMQQEKGRKSVLGAGTRGGSHASKAGSMGARTWPFADQAKATAKVLIPPFASSFFSVPDTGKHRLGLPAAGHSE